MLGVAMLAVTGVVARRDQGEMTVSFARKLNTDFEEQHDPSVHNDDVDHNQDGGAGFYSSGVWDTEREWVSLDPVATPWPLIAEAENFSVAAGAGWAVTEWGHDHYYGATFSNTFASRKALLHSTAAGVGTATSAPLPVPTAGTWYVCVRYEAAYRFETEFKVTVLQGGATKLSKMYGQRRSNKIWSFGWSLRNHEIAGCGANPTPECHWTWGATENWVYEYYPVSLAAGPATIELLIANTTSTPGMAALADRNVDAVLLTQNLTDIEMRELNEQQLALDGLFSQHDEVFAKITNHGSGDIKVNVPISAYHSAYPSQHLVCIPYCTPQRSTGKVYSSVANLVIPVAQGTTTPKWVEVGSRLDTFNDGTWTFTSTDLKASYGCVGGKCVKQFGGNYTTSTCHRDCAAPGPPPSKPALFDPSFTIEFGVKPVLNSDDSAIVSIGSFTSTGAVSGRYGPTTELELTYDASTVWSKRLRSGDASIYEAVAEAKTGTVPPGSHPPVLTPLYGYTFCSSSSIRDVEPSCTLAASESADYAAAHAEFMTMFPMVDTSGYQDPRKASPRALKLGRGYYEARAAIKNLTSLELTLKNFSAEGIADKVLVVSMGDEISLSVPGDPVAAQSAFVAWCKKNKLEVPGRYNVTWGPGGVTNPKLFYYSNQFANSFGLDAMAAATALLRNYLPNANIGANYSPMTYGTGGYIQNVFMYPVNKAVTMFRSGSMTLPWAEDYAWQSPLGSQQMMTALLDLFRAGTRGQTSKERNQMMIYVLAHAPGNTATSWRRNFYNYLGHGMTIINLYEFRPCTASITENYVDTGWGMYSAVHTALNELSRFEDIIQDGTVASGDVGLWCSDAFDIWGPATPPNEYGKHQNTFLSGKRALFIALLHAELTVDIVVEADIGQVLDSYKVIVLADTHVSDAAAAALSKWVDAGGTLVATAGAGMQNEYNNSNTAMAKLLGVDGHAMIEPEDESIQFIKQDIRFSKPLTQVTWNGSAGETSAAVLGARHVFTPRTGTKVTARFADDTAASTSLAVGKGRTMYHGWLIGLSYFLPAIPLRPADRSGTDQAFTHFVPSNFSMDVLELVRNAAMVSKVQRQVVCSNHLVHGRAVVSKGGQAVVVPLTNWASEKNLTRLQVNVTLAVVKPGMEATLASGGAVHESPGGSVVYGVQFVLDHLAVADALILRHKSDDGLSVA